jgi:hypothetical protein
MLDQRQPEAEAEGALLLEEVRWGNARRQGKDEEGRAAGDRIARAIDIPVSQKVVSGQAPSDQEGASQEEKRKPPHSLQEIRCSIRQQS